MMDRTQLRFYHFQVSILTPCKKGDIPRIRVSNYTLLPRMYGNLLIPPRRPKHALQLGMFRKDNKNPVGTPTGSHCIYQQAKQEREIQVSHGRTGLYTIVL